MVIGEGYLDKTLTEAEVRDLAAEALARADLAGKRVLIIIPDHTRTAPIPLFFHLFHQLLRGRVAALDYLIALGTHQPMSEDALSRLVGVPVHDGWTGASLSHSHTSTPPHSRVFNHRWDFPETFTTLGIITKHETHALSNGLLSLDVPVKINRVILDYDQLVICGPVFPHEVVGFSGGHKYFFPGISGPEMINVTHWLGALLTSMAIIGTPDTPVRRMIDRAASFIPVPTLCFALVGTVRRPAPTGLAGLYAGPPEEAWRAAADLSARLHIVYVEQPFLYAPHITEVSYTHGHVIDQVGYHVRDYFVKQWDRFKDYPWAVLAHSTHLRGVGTYKNGVERSRIRVTLATGIPEERCRRINLGYLDPTTVDIDGWANRENEGILLVCKAGEMLYRISESASQRISESAIG